MIAVMALSERHSPTGAERPHPAPVHHEHPNVMLPMHSLRDHGLGESTAYELITSDLLLDGQARLNLATFVTTWMPSLAATLMSDTADKNMIDKDEYPQTARIESHCVNILADLWHAPESDSGSATGCSTTGSSEAAMLAGMAMKWRWRKRREAEGKPTDKPNLIAGANVQVCWEKFMRYWDVEPRLVPMEGDRYHLTADQIAPHVDENTIGVVGILGSTFDGSYEPIKEIADELDRIEAEQGLDIPLHVDAASGGFVAPFIQPSLEWDFRIPRVCSINASGHKYGLVYPGVGWALWRDKASLPEELIFNVNYLGGNMPTFALNFSRPGSEVIAQYFMFTSLGREGYRRVIQNAQDVAMYLSSEIEQLGCFDLISRGDELPVFAFTVKPGRENYTVFDVSGRMRERGWLIPAYTFPENRQDLSVLRIVVRAGMNFDMAEQLIEGLKAETADLEALSQPLPPSKSGPKKAFAH